MDELVIRTSPLAVFETQDFRANWIPFRALRKGTKAKPHRWNCFKRIKVARSSANKVRVSLVNLTHKATFLLNYTGRYRSFL